MRNPNIGENERCPFLNSKNLCEIIINHGEGKLCDICTMHPRFRNFYESRTEIGIGLCCEAAAEIILSKTDVTTLEEIGYDAEEAYEDEHENVFLGIRDEIFKTITNRSISLIKRVKKLISDYSVKIPETDMSGWAELYLSLERLDSTWTNELDILKNADITSKSSLPDEPFEQLLVYFIYRHLPESMYDLRFSERIAFSVISVMIIYTLCAAQDGDMKNLADIARMYSAEIEYSEENINKLLEFIITE